MISLHEWVRILECAWSRGKVEHATIHRYVRAAVYIFFLQFTIEWTRNKIVFARWYFHWQKCIIFASKSVSEWNGRKKNEDIYHFSEWNMLFLSFQQSKFTFKWFLSNLVAENVHEFIDWSYLAEWLIWIPIS